MTINTTALGSGMQSISFRGGATQQQQQGAVAATGLPLLEQLKAAVLSANSSRGAVSWCPLIGSAS